MFSHFDHVYRGVNVRAQSDNTVVLENADGSRFNGYNGFFYTTYASNAYVNTVLGS